MKFYALIIGCAWLLPPLMSAQSGIGYMKNVDKIDIPFEYKSNLIIVNVTFNKLFPLKFIFDTGAENTILAKREITDLMGVHYEREFRMLGSDLKTELKAYLVRGIRLDIENLLLPYQSLFVLDDDYFHFDQMTGLNIHGIIGADILRGLVVKINYERKVITIMTTNYFTEPPVGYETLPLQIFRNKPYLNCDLQIRKGEKIPVKLLLDSGAMLSLLLHTDTNEAFEPPATALKGQLAAGLGGYLEGHLGRAHSLKIGNTIIHEIPTNFQKLPDSMDISILNKRNGIIGNLVLDRYHVIIDFARENIHFIPNKRFKETYAFDKSGLVIIAGGAMLNTFTILDVLPGSPAAEAGLQKGDEIRRVNWHWAGILSLIDIQRILRGKEGKSITLVAKRNGERFKVRFKLRELF